MADDNEIQVQITATTAGLQTGLEQASASVKQSATEMASALDGAKQASNYSMMEARHGVMMLGEEFGVRLPRAVSTFVASIGPVGSAMAAAFPVLAIATGVTVLIEHFAKLHEAQEKIAESQAELNSRLDRGNDELLTQQERLIGLTRGPLAEYEAKIIDVGKYSVDLKSDMDQVVKNLDQQNGFWVKLTDNVRRYLIAAGSAMTVQAGGQGVQQPGRYDEKDADRFMEKIREEVRTNDDLNGALQKVGAELVKVHGIEQSEGSDNAMAQRTENARKSIQAFYEELTQRQQKAANERKILRDEEGKKEASAYQSTAEACLKGVEQANAAELQAEDKGAEEALKSQEAAIKLQVALAVEGGDKKAQAELNALPKYIAAQQAFTQAKLAALDKDHVAELKANEDERALLERGNVGGSNNAKLIENANQKAAIEQKYQTDRQAIVAAGTTAVVQLETEEVDQRTALAKRGEEERERDAARAYSLAQAGSTERIAIASREFDRISALYSATTEQYKAAQAKMTQAVREAQKEREKIADEDEKKRIASEQRAANQIANGYAQLTMGLIKGTQSFTQTAVSLMDRMAENFVRSMIRTMMTHAMVEEVKTSATLAGTAERDSLEHASNVKSILGSADTAAGKSFEWASSWGGPVAGAIAAAAAFAGVMAFDSFDTGGIVPNTGFSFVHQGEGVLTAPTTKMLQNVNNVINGGALNSPALATAGGGGDIHLHIHAHGQLIDKSFWSQNQGAIMGTLKEAMKNRRS